MLPPAPPLRPLPKEPAGKPVELPTREFPNGKKGKPIVYMDDKKKTMTVDIKEIPTSVSTAEELQAAFLLPAAKAQSFNHINCQLQS